MIKLTNKKRILCLFRDRTKYDSWISLFSENGYFVYDNPDLLNAMAHIYNDPPDIILLSTEIEGWHEFLVQLKNDSVYGHLIVVLLVERKKFTAMLPDMTKLPIDDFIFEDLPPSEILLRIRIKDIHGNIYLDANPLTRLPGNYTIMARIQDFIDQRKPYGLVYADIDNFKAFNDKYGFARGDDMIRMTARILANVVRSYSAGEGFVGHIGGDDFVFILAAATVEKACKQVLQNFDLVSSTLSDDEDRLVGHIRTKNRQGKWQKFPLPTISLAVIDSRITCITHPGEAAAMAAELKKNVKKLSGSNYMIDRRTNIKIPGMDSQ